MIDSQRRSSIPCKIWSFLSIVLYRHIANNESLVHDQLSTLFLVLLASRMFPMLPCIRKWLATYVQYVTVMSNLIMLVSVLLQVTIFNKHY